MTRYTDIIARLKEAKGPDRELFGDACRLVIPNTIHAWNEHSRFIRLIDAEAWIDAALTLLPEDGIVEGWHLKHNLLLEWRPIVQAHGRVDKWVAEISFTKHAANTTLCGDTYRGEHETSAALALLIAIMEAREGMDGKDG